MKKVILMGLLISIFGFANAQKEQKKEIKTQVEITEGSTPGKKRVRIEKSINGKVEIIEKEIDAKDIEDGQSLTFIEDIQDTLIHDIKGEKQVRVIIKDSDERDFEWEEEGDGDSPRWYGSRDYARSRKENYNRRKGEFEFEMERLHDKMADLPNRLKGARLYELDDHIFKFNDATTIRSLDVFTNRPDTDVLNVRFYAPGEGDVSITVLDLKGNVEAKSTAKNFKGEYVGQLKLKKGAKGTFVVIVAQGEDGQTKKIKID